ncbi:MAG: DUF1489 family protein [Rhizobiaceae bacterium]|nr:DUF1489 family protein [Rhizobiaceae bacterium]
MSLNLIKLCVGAESVEDQREWSKLRLAEMAASGVEVCLFHTTRMAPKRIDQLLDGGSLYWVIKGKIQLRQRLIDIRPFVDTDGIRRCKLMLDSDLIATEWQPKRAFQGWRYLLPEEAPADLDVADMTMPGHLKAELSELGLL